jgi:hypothetical protein
MTYDNSHNDMRDHLHYGETYQYIPTEVDRELGRIEWMEQQGEEG